MTGKKNGYVFIGLALAGFLAYRNCFDIFIPADDYGLLSLFKRGIILGFSDKELASPPYLVSFPLLYGLYHLMEMNPAGWILTGLLLHIVNAFAVFLISERLMKSILTSQNIAISIFSSLIFLISPYQTEAVLWAPTDIPVLVTTSFFLFALLQLLLFMVTNKRTALYYSHVLFLLAVYSYESSFVFPAIAAVCFFLFRSVYQTVLSLKEFILKILLPQSAILLSYFTTTKIIFGEWIWHAGSMDVSVPIQELGTTLAKYLAKFILLFRYLPASADALGATFARVSAWALLPVLILMFVIGIFVLLKKKSNSGKALTALFFCFLLSLIPVLPLDSSFLKYIYTDRYGYLPSAFFYIFLCSGIFFLLRKYALPVLTGYAVLCWVLLMQTLSVWLSVNHNCNQLIKNYGQFLGYDHIYLLDVPAYDNGLAAFRTAFDETMFMQYDTPLKKNKVISGSYHDSPADSIVAARVSGNTIEVKSNPRKTPYFSINCGWAESYATDEYTVEFDPSGCSYLLTFKEGIPSNSVFIYAAGNAWKKVQ